MQNTQSDKKPLVSFIITCYNLPPEMVGKCIGSITALSLSGHEREIIVIDDGSDNNVIGGFPNTASISYTSERATGA